MDTQDYAEMVLRGIKQADKLNYPSHIHDFPDEVMLGDQMAIAEAIKAEGYTTELKCRKYGRNFAYQIITTGWRKSA
jgi:hypothetical protein